MRKLKFNFEKRVLKRVGIGYGLNTLKTNKRTSKRPYGSPNGILLSETV